MILGIDPGTVVLGYGLVRASKGNLSMLEMGVLRLEKYGDHPQRLQKIFSLMEELILRYQPNCMALEAPFFGKNVQSMLKLGRAQGVAMAAGMLHNLEVAEYSPRTVKQKTTGKGSATKEAVRAMLELTLRFQHEAEMPLDATDALAVALCHYYSTLASAVYLSGENSGNNATSGASLASPKKGSRKKNAAAWESFLEKNPERMG